MRIYVDLRKIGTWIATAFVFLTVCPSGNCQVAEGGSFKVIKLIGDLNDKAETNIKARQELSAMGEKAIPGLVDEVKKYMVGTSSAELSAARCLRVLTEMKSSAAISIAADILTLLNQTKAREQTSRVLLAEALRYLSHNASNNDAVKSIVRFVEKSPEKWRAEIFWYPYYIDVWGSSMGGYQSKEISYWEWIGAFGTTPAKKPAKRDKRGWKQLNATTLTIDVFTPLNRLVKERHLTVAKLLANILHQLPYKFTLNLEYLSTDGFTPIFHLYHSDKLSADSKTKWIDGEARPRILILQWLRNLKYVKATPEIQKLLRSSHKDERDFSLLVLEEITK